LTDRTPPLALVVDTNVVLDWLVFRDPSSLPLAAAIGDRRHRWIATAAMRQELEHVLTRGNLERWQPDVASILATWDKLSVAVEAPVSPPVNPLRCTDPDDQKFLDLALQTGADALLSRDRAVLKLAGRARPLGLRILTPATWAQTLAAL